MLMQIGEEQRFHNAPLHFEKLTICSESLTISERLIGKERTVFEQHYFLSH